MFETVNDRNDVFDVNKIVICDWCIC